MKYLKPPGTRERRKMELNIVGSLRRHYTYCLVHHGCLCRHKLVFALTFLLVVVILVVHLLLLPKVNGTYNDECYMSKGKLHDLRYAVQTIGRTMEKYNITYWLDYGTLLGTVQREDVLPWDGDADISFLLKDDDFQVHKELHKLYDIISNELRAWYKGEIIDYMRWEERRGYYYGKKATILYKYYPESVLANENAIVKYHHKLESFPKAWAVPTKTINFHGEKLHIPNSPHKLLSHRYSFTYNLGLSVPYKWKCYVPCWIRRANGC